jgi:hypothetical protein
LFSSVCFGILFVFILHTDCCQLFLQSSISLKIFMILSRVLVTKTRFGLVIGFINYLQVVTTTKYNTVTDFHTTNHSTLIFSVYFHYSSLSVSWQRIYNTGTIKVSLNHALPISLYYNTHKVFKSHVKSSQVDF